MSIRTDVEAALGEAIDPTTQPTADDLALAIRTLRGAILLLATEVDDTRLWLEQISADNSDS